MFVNAEAGDYRLLPGSPCIHARDNSAVSPDELDLAGNPRIMFGGKEIRVDMGAYEHRAETPALQPLGGGLRLIWSSNFGKTYSVSCSDGLTTWHLTDDNVPSAGASTLWMDPIGWPPRIPTRFYRVKENE
jgi:hypothetical protein